MPRRPAPRPTIRDVAQQAGVSESTVSRVLSGHATISEATRARVLAAARQSRYEGVAMQRGPQPAARARPARMVGVVVAALHNSFYTELLQHLQGEFQALGYHVTLIIDSLLGTDDMSAFAPLIDGYLSGVVFTTATVQSSVVAELARRNVPVVLAVRSVDDIAVDIVEADNVRAGEDAARHLVELGHRRIGFVMGPSDTSTARDRFGGAAQMLAAHGIAADPARCIWGSYTHESGYSGAVQMLSLPEPPTAIIAGNDTVALGVMDAARKIGVPIPDRLSLIGFDDIAMAGWSFVGLTTLHQPIPEMARLAARRLVARIREPVAPVHRDLLPTNLVQRETTARVAGATA